jgi:hypothetical protein
MYVPAESHQIELEAAERAYKELTALVGTTTPGMARSSLTEQLVALLLHHNAKKPPK